MNFIKKSPTIKLQRFCLLLFLSFVALDCYPQDTKYPSFLWEITGNKLSKPSYLLGTVHLKDRRLIDANDSIFVALSNTESFAMELHPDSVYKEIFAYRYGKKKLPKTLELTDGQKEEFKRRYQQEYGIPPDSIAFKNPGTIRYIMNPSHDKEDDLKSIFDSYLYGVAKSHNKIIIGLEPVRDQRTTGKNHEPLIELDHRDSARYYAEFEEITRCYVNGDLQKLMDLMGPHIDDDEMKSRNYTMLDRLTGQLQEMSVFAAVGAAHLPGSQGLIHLLREQGYTLRPVRTLNTRLSDGFSINYETQKWTTFIDTANHYEVQLPDGYFYHENSTYKSLLNYGDMSTESEMLVSARYVGNLAGMPPEEFIEEQIKKSALTEGHELLSRKSIDRHGASGTQILTRWGKHPFKWEFWLANNTWYTLCLYIKKGEPDTYLANRFFESFKTHKQISTVNNAPFVHEAGAFSVQFPNAPKYMLNTGVQNNGNIDIEYRLHNHLAVDKENKINYFVRYNDYPLGYMLDDRDAVYQTMKTELAGMDPNVGEPVRIRKDGLEGASYSAQLPQSNMFLEMWTRGNRVYLVMQENLDKKNNRKNESFFSSFHAVAYRQTQWQPFNLKNINLELPATDCIPFPATDSLADPDFKTNTYVALDTNSSTVFSVQRVDLPKYYRLNNNDSLYYSWYKLVKELTEELITYKPVKCHNFNAAFYTTKDTVKRNFTANIIWVNGNKLYQIGASADSITVSKLDAVRMMESVELHTKAEPFDLFGSKADLLFSDLLHRDTLISSQAHNAIESYYVFEKDELPLLYNALQEKYPDDDEPDGIRSELIDNLSIVNDEFTVQVLKELLSKPSSTDGMRKAILTTVMAIDSTHYDWYLTALNEYKPQSGSYNGMLLRPLTDSLPYTLHNFDRVAPLFEVETYRSILISTCLNLLKGNQHPAAKEIIAPYLPQVIKWLDEDMKTFLADGVEPGGFEEYLIANYLQLYTVYGLKDEIHNLSLKLSGFANMDFLQATIVSAFLQLDLPLDNELRTRSFDNLDRRLVVMNHMKDARRMDLVPSIYKAQTEIGKMIVNEYITMEWDAPMEMNFVGKITEEDRPYYVYECKMEENGPIYRALYSPVEGEEEFHYDYTNVYSDFETNDENWESHAKILIQQLKSYF